MRPRAEDSGRDRVLRFLLLLVACAAPAQMIIVLAVPPLRHGTAAVVLLLCAAAYLSVVTIGARRYSRARTGPQTHDPGSGRTAGGRRR